MLPAHCSNSSRFSYSNTKNIKPREFDSPSLSPRRASSARLLFFMGGRELLAGLNQGKSASPAAALRPRFFIVPYFSSMGAQVRERAFIFIFFFVRRHGGGVLSLAGYYGIFERKWFEI